MNGRIKRTFRKWLKRGAEGASLPVKHRTFAQRHLATNLRPNHLRTLLPPEILWLLDAPMFIDDKQVDAFYDAVVRPDYEGTSVTLSESVNKSAHVRRQLDGGCRASMVRKGRGDRPGGR